MKSINFKEKTIAISLILLLTISSAVAILPLVGADTLPDIKTYPGLTVSPNPTGVGQSVQVIMFLTCMPPSVGIEHLDPVHGGWTGFSLIITKPDGTSETMGPFETDPSGMYQVSYTPATTGTYTFKFSFAGQSVTNVTWGGMGGVNYFNFNGNFLPSSRTTTLTVQEDLVPWFQESPLPTADWTTPINGEMRTWYQISGPWLQSTYNASGPFNPYTTASSTSHIIWTKNMGAGLGGIIGGDYGSLSFQKQNTAAFGVFSSPVIMGGRLYFNGPANPSGSQFYCYDLRTGQPIWNASGSITMGQILNWRTIQQKWILPYLWSIPTTGTGVGAATTGGTYRMYDAQTGQLLCSFTGAAIGGITGTSTATCSVKTLSPVYPSEVAGGGAGDLSAWGAASGGGTLLVYVMDLTANKKATWVACWNSTKALVSYANNSVEVTFPAAGGTIPWANGLQWNVTVPYVTLRNVNVTGVPGASQRSLVVTAVDSDVLVIDNRPMDSSQSAITYVGINTNTGAIMWTKNQTIPQYITGPGAPCSSGEGAFVTYSTDEMKIIAYDEATGNQLWEISPMKNDFATMAKGTSVIAYGNFYIGGYDGFMHCISIKNGTELWSTMSALGGTELPEEAYPFTTIAAADGKIYASTGKTYETSPLYRGHMMYCFDAITGEKLWNISGQYSSIAISDGFLVTANSYDNVVYCFGKGPTATTVTAPMTAISAGSQVVIQGTVTDQSSGLVGTPAISDKDMTAWMQYKFMDYSMPTTSKGVVVSIDAVDPNGNFVHLGDTTSDNTGNYGYIWTPPNIPGTYTVIATFAGSESYYSSLGETTAFVVDAPAQTAAPQAIQSTVDYSYYFVGTAVAIILAIALATLLIIRKRP